MEAFQLGVKGGHQLKHLLLGKERKGESGKAAWMGEIRKAQEWSSVLTWTATPKLFPSSIRGICSCNQVVTWEEGTALKPHQLPTQFPGSCPPLFPCPQWVEVCHVCPEPQGLEFWLYLLCPLLLRPGRCHAQLAGTKEDKGWGWKWEGSPG